MGRAVAVGGGEWVLRGVSGHHLLYGFFWLGDALIL